ncbi:hypothetical protein PG996_008065 [Apiospora saccharicola]|uniref:Uncharacterized protein n=1 Tax=Apiospora saccharicola TaxID=335842 RepID=A0ABR1UWU7_9PEZI
MAPTKWTPERNEALLVAFGNYLIKSATKWTPERNEALLVAFGNYLIKSASHAQQVLIEEHMQDTGFTTCTWEAIRYVHSLAVRQQEQHFLWQQHPPFR